MPFHFAMLLHGHSMTDVACDMQAMVRMRQGCFPSWGLAVRAVDSILTGISRVFAITKVARHPREIDWVFPLVYLPEKRRGGAALDGIMPQRQ